MARHSNPDPSPSPSPSLNNPNRNNPTSSPDPDPDQVDGEELACSQFVCTMGPWAALAQDWFDIPVPMTGIKVRIRGEGLVRVRDRVCEPEP